MVYIMAENDSNLLSEPFAFVFYIVLFSHQAGAEVDIVSSMALNISAFLILVSVVEYPIFVYISFRSAMAWLTLVTNVVKFTFVVSPRGFGVG